MIKISKVSKRYQSDGAAVQAIANIDLDIHEGEIFGIIGASGAGKSTLIRTLNLLERPDSGSILIDAEDITRYSSAQLQNYRRKVGMIFQHFNLIKAKTVAENIRYPLKLTGTYSKAEMDRRVRELADLVELSDQLDKYPAQLSGGQKQRVGIARALANHPRLLLCDEATSALDPQTTLSILRLLRDINRRFGLTIVLITHEMDVIRAVCDRVAVLDKGLVVEHGLVADILLYPRHPVTRALVRESSHHEDSANIGTSLGLPGPLLRLTFLGPATYQPVLERISKTFEISFNILEGVIGRIKDTPYGQLTVQVIGSKRSLLDVENAFAQQSIHCEVLSR